MLDRGAKTRAAVLAAQTNPEVQRLVQAVAAVLETEPGKLLFANLYFRGGFDKTDNAGGDQTVADFNRGRRALYVELRSLVPKTHRKTLLEVELLAEDGWGSGLPKPKAEEADPAK
jgi:hypothetical protein